MIVRIRQHHRLLRWGMRMEARKIEKDLVSYVQSAGDELPHDAPTFTRTPEQEAMFEETFRLGYIQDEEGVYEMTEALWGWGFDPKDVKQPVDIFYGTSDDIISPEMPRYLAGQLPNSTLHEWDGAGHYGFIDRERWTEFVTTAKG